MKRGDIWIVEFGAPSGPEQSGQRPAILLQDDGLLSALTTVIVLPLTTNLKRLSLPTTLLIPSGESGLTQDSVALCHQIQVRGKARLLRRLGELSENRLAEVQDVLLDALGL
jgi:mRNA interferase MazF